MPRTIRFDRTREELQFEDTCRQYRDVEGYVFHESELAQFKAVDLKHALQSAARLYEADEMDVFIVEGDEDEFDDEWSPPGPVHISLQKGTLVVQIHVITKSEEFNEETLPDVYRAILAPYLARRRAALRDIEMTVDYHTSPFVWRIDIECNLRNRLVRELYEIGSGAISLLEAAESGELTRETTIELLRAGRADVLIGQPEGPWLDVKSSHYDLDTQHGKISIAQAVARFANAEHGGIVVVGMRGKKVPAGEVIHSVCPVPLDGRTLRRYQSALEHHLYPPPDLLDIEEISDGSGLGIVFLHIPPQPEELKPFLVHGAVVDGRMEGAFISIVRRRGEGSIPITAPAIHSTLAAGRALLRRGQLPDAPQNLEGSP
ncbi:ATP-binding protein [Streptomyces glaucescens]|uniref:ATP-binding protein n=1 Tax=Streptomyces glaucescens TaxID=1907 RepID=UPI00117F049D|nr:ATP-binding protein [Streptomyces glaucescens]